MSHCCMQMTPAHYRIRCHLIRPLCGCGRHTAAGRLMKMDRPLKAPPLRIMLTYYVTALSTTDHNNNQPLPPSAVLSCRHLARPVINDRTAGLNPTSAELFAALSERSDVNRRIYHVLVARFRTEFAPGKDQVTNCFLLTCLGLFEALEDKACTQSKILNCFYFHSTCFTHEVKPYKLQHKNQ